VFEIGKLRLELSEAIYVPQVKGFPAEGVHSYFLIFDALLLTDECLNFYVASTYVNCKKPKVCCKCCTSGGDSAEVYLTCLL